MANETVIVSLLGSPGAGVPTGGDTGQVLTKISDESGDTGWRDTDSTAPLIPWGVACSDETTQLTTGADKITWRNPFAADLIEIKGNLSAAGVGATVLDVLQNGTSILSAPITIDSGQLSSVTASVQPVILTSALANDAAMSVTFVSVGTNAAGAKVTLVFRKAP